MTDMSGRVPVANQLRDPTNLLRYDWTTAQRCDGRFLCGIESTGIPDLYGEGLVVAESCDSPAISIIFSVNYDCDRWTDSFYDVYVYWNLMPTKCETFPMKSTGVSFDNACSKCCSTASLSEKYMKSSTYRPR